jgi:hypothetical protein
MTHATRPQRFASSTSDPPAAVFASGGADGQSEFWSSVLRFARDLFSGFPHKSAPTQTRVCFYGERLFTSCKCSFCPSSACVCWPIVLASHRHNFPECWSQVLRSAGTKFSDALVAVECGPCTSRTIPCSAGWSRSRCSPAISTCLIRASASRAKRVRQSH